MHASIQNLIVDMLKKQKYKIWAIRFIDSSQQRFLTLFFTWDPFFIKTLAISHNTTNILSSDLREVLDKTHLNHAQ